MSLAPRSPSLVAIETTTSAVLVLGGLLGNSVLLIALYRDPSPRLKTSTVLLITALALIDLLKACTTGTLFVASLATGKLWFNKLGCQISGFFLYFLTSISMATAALTSVNRFFCVLKPAVFKRVFTYRRSLSHIGCLAVVAAFVVLVPIVFGWATFSFNPLSAACAWKFTNRRAEIGYTCLNLFTFPVCSLSIMTYCYKEVSRFIRQHKVNIAYLTTHEIHITKALFVIVFVFFASFCVPSFLAIILFRVILHGSCIPREMVLLALYLVHANSAINPWIYGVMSPLVRNKIKKVFFKRRVQLQAGDVTVVRAYQRKSKSPKENMIAPDSTLQNVITQK